MPIAFLITTFVFAISFSGLAKAAETPPAGCFSPAPGNTLEIEGNSDVKAWIGQRPDGKWDACLQLIGCNWSIKDASVNLPIIRPYLVDALVHPKCNVRWIGSTSTSECENSLELVTSFANIASLISNSLGSTSGICSVGAAKVLADNTDTFEFGGSTWSRYWLPIDGWCIEGFVRLNDGASSLGIGKDCPADTARWSSFASNLTNSGFLHSNTWLVGHTVGDIFGKSVDVSVSPITIGSASFAAGGLNQAYVLSWLQSVADAANSSVGIDRTDDPLPSVSGAVGNSGRFLHWLAAASSRLSTIPFDASSGWDDVESRRARKWSALIDLSDETILRGTHFRAEIARSP